jgi:hypothetical protein
MIQGQGNMNRGNGCYNLMGTLTDSLNKAVKDGYVDNFRVTRYGLFSDIKHKTYFPGEVKIVDYCRFEGESDPSDNEIMYVIETDDGDKGILIDAFGPYSDQYINNFITQVRAVQKKE